MKEIEINRIEELLLKYEIDKQCIELEKVLTEATGTLFTNLDISSFPAPEATSKKNFETYRKFLLDVIEKYKLIPVGVKHSFKTFGGNSCNDFYSYYVSAENKFAITLRCDGPVSNIYNFYLDEGFICTESADIFREFILEVSKFFKDLRESGDPEDQTICVKLLFTNQNGGGICCRNLAIPPRNKFNLEDNYSKEFCEFVPGKMDDFFKEKAGGIVIFRGDPGTGKSTYCKHLIAKYKRDVDFVIAPQDVILSNPEGFRNYLLNSSDYYIESNEERMKPQVFIIEDCEKLLVDRDSLSGNNTSIILSDILNYSDGIVGDLVQSKFIFTFNTNLSKIDKALLRKGRMKLNYEFTTLKGDDLKNLMEKKNLPYTEENLKKGLSLAEIYNLEEKDYQREEKRKIGF